MNRPPYTALLDSRLGYGLYTSLPELPRGWQWRQLPDDFLLARDPTGRLFYADFAPDGFLTLSLRNIATWRDALRTFGRLRPGAEFLDKRVQFYLPTR